MGTHFFEFENRTQPSHTEAFSHIMKHRRLLLAAVERANRILGHILEGPKVPDIISLQEVTRDAGD